MTTLRLLGPEAVLLALALMGLLSGALMPVRLSTLPVRIHSMAAAENLPHEALFHLVDHGMYFGRGMGGYQQSLQPILKQLRSQGLTFVEQYWRWVGDVPQEVVAQQVELPLVSLNGNKVDLELLARYIGPRYLREPGELIYIPLGRGVMSAVTGEMAYRNYAVVVFDYSPASKSRPRRAQDFGFGPRENVQQVQVGPYLAMSPRYPIPQEEVTRYQLDSGETAEVRQQGTHFRIQLYPGE
ncbi:MAG: hypothetical protein GEEBNDBF_01156 [bacterium]|nr:hypothetical protein [bacterium]